MQPDPEAVAARESLGATRVLAIHLYGLTAAVRAILATHHQPQEARKVTYSFSLHIRP